MREPLQKVVDAVSGAGNAQLAGAVIEAASAQEIAKKEREQIQFWLTTAAAIATVATFIYAVR